MPSATKDRCPTLFYVIPIAQRGILYSMYGDYANRKRFLLTPLLAPTRSSKLKYVELTIHMQTLLIRKFRLEGTVAYG